MRKEILRELSEELVSFDQDCKLAIDITIQKTKNKILGLIKEELEEITKSLNQIKEKNKNKAGLIEWGVHNEEDSYICMRLGGQKLGLIVLTDKIEKALKI